MRQVLHTSDRVEIEARRKGFWDTQQIQSKMAMHVPKAPGFAQMLKDGAKVSIFWTTSVYLVPHM